MAWEREVRLNRKKLTANLDNIARDRHETAINLRHHVTIRYLMHDRVALKT